MKATKTWGLEERDSNSETEPKPKHYFGTSTFFPMPCCFCFFVNMFVGCCLLVSLLVFVLVFVGLFLSFFCYWPRSYCSLTSDI